MAATKVSREDAEEYLAALQQTGQGWWRQVGLAVQMGVHRSLGMDRREFAAQIGNRLIDAREAIVDLHSEKLSQTAIADVLGVSKHTVQKVLMEEGLIPVRELGPGGGPSLFGTPGRPADPRLTGAESTGSVDETGAESTDRDGTADDPEAEIEKLLAKLEQKETEIKAANAKAQKERKELRERLDRATHNAAELARELEQAKKDNLSPADKARLEREREAMLASIEAKFAPVHASSVVQGLVEATESLKELIELGLTEALYEKIERAHTGFVGELTVAAASVGREVKTS